VRPPEHDQAGPCARAGLVLQRRSVMLEDRDRCRAAGIGDDVPFATKPQLARTMIGRAVKARVSFNLTWLTFRGLV
jgi:hypothetical protein